MAINPQHVIAALSHVQEPTSGKDFIALNAVHDLVCGAEGLVSFSLMIPGSARTLSRKVQEEATAAVMKIPGVQQVQVKVQIEAKVENSEKSAPISAGGKKIIAIASGKGGVGKSTTAVNLAIALERAGARVGLLDADIYGPNIPMMMGVPETERPRVNPEQQMLPLEGHGIKIMSIAFLVEPGKAIIWRGPMLHGIIKQFLQSVVWGELDYLLVDLPPGTGDASLSLVQTVPLSGAVIVTTPQAVAQSDVRRSIAMFNEVRVPILGIMENMSGLDCPNCQHHINLFEGSGGESLSKEYSIPLLGKVPFDPLVGRGGDRGVPIIASRPESKQAQIFSQAAEQLRKRLENADSQIPVIQLS